LEPVLEIIAKEHKRWIKMLRSMGCNSSLAEDLVQEMYIKIDQYLKTHRKNIMYNDEVNYFFVYVTLRNLYMDYIRQKNKVNVISLDDMSYFNEVRQNQFEEYSEKHKTNEYNKHLSIQEWYQDELYLELLEKENISEAEYTKEELGKYYMRRIFKEVFLDNVNVSELSRSTNITYWSLRNTIKIIKKEIKKYYETRRHSREDI